MSTRQLARISYWNIYGESDIFDDKNSYRCYSVQEPCIGSSRLVFFFLLLLFCVVNGSRTRGVIILCGIGSVYYTVTVSKWIQWFAKLRCNECRAITYLYTRVNGSAGAYICWCVI